MFGRNWKRTGQRRWGRGVAVLASLLPATFVLAEEEPVSLLKLNSAGVERVSQPGIPVERLALLVDGDPGTTCAFSPADGAAVDVIYHFGGDIVSPERLTIQIAQDGIPESPAGRVEVLASSLSAEAGYRSLRADPLQATSEPQEFRFQPSAARWMLIRITPAPGAAELAVAELDILGRNGPPVSHYAFKESPAEAFEVLNQLEQSVDVTLSKAEKTLFADANDGKFDDVSFAEAALLASGVSDDHQRRRYLGQMVSLVEQARDAVAEADSPFQQGDRLLRWLHENAMSGDYSAGQTNVSTILETGSYNCVSSATIYNILGRRLDLDLRAIEVPDHAFSILYDGTQHADVETTTPRGFNPARNPEVLKELQEKKGLRYIPDRNRAQRREISEAGLVALIYYNHGVKLTDEERYAEALGAYFRALQLDREFSSAVKNVLAVLSNWSHQLAEAGEYEQALDVVSTGLRLAPKDATLRHNQQALWTNWANHAIDSGDTERALAILSRAHEAVPDGGFEATQSWVFIRPAEKLIEDGDWDQALSLSERGLTQIAPRARDDLKKWRSGVYLRWSSAELDEAHFRAAADVLSRGLENGVDEERFANTLAYLAQEWSWSAYKSNGLEAAQSALGELRRRFANVTSVAEASENFAMRAVNEMRRSGKYEDALQALNALSETLRAETEKTLRHSIYDDWADTYMQDRDWESAVSVYEDALRETPESQHLRKNFGYAAAQLANSVARDQGQKQAAGKLAKLIERHPKIDELKDAAEAHLHQAISESLEHGNFDAALETVKQFEDALQEPQRAKASRIIYDRWAGQLIQKKEWEQAVGVYENALKQYPDDTHLAGNAVAAWNRWAATHIQAKEWGKAISVYEQALEAFPENGTLKNNLKYCQQQLDSAR